MPKGSSGSDNGAFSGLTSEAVSDIKSALSAENEIDTTGGIKINSPEYKAITDTKKYLSKISADQKTLILESELKKNGITNYTIARSKTSFGNSNYVTIRDKNGVEVQRIRVSDHSVGHRRLFNDGDLYFDEIVSFRQTRTVIKRIKKYS